jgi:Zn-dependent protease with chaperone function
MDNNDFRRRSTTSNRRQTPPSSATNSGNYQYEEHNYDHYGRGRQRQQSDPATGKKKKMKQQLYFLATSLISIAVCYLTPISEIIVQEFLLPQVPVQADIDMGRLALAELKQHTERNSQGSTRRHRTYNNNGPYGPQPPKAHDVYDPIWSPLIESVGWALVDVAEQYYQNLPSLPAGELINDYAWDFGIIVFDDDPTIINAFCLPGGIIRISKNLLNTLQLTEGELAALLGHEMGHALHRHVQGRRLQHQIVEYVLKAVIRLFGEDEVQQQRFPRNTPSSSPSFGQAIGDLLVKSADWLGQQSFSRRDEYQADGTSWDLLVHSRVYDPRALRTLLEKLWRANGRQNDGGRTSWDGTHPGTKDRIDFIEDKYKSLSDSERRRLQTENRIR